MRITVLAGGIGGARFLRGVRAACPDADITAVVNTGDDVTLHGLRIAPDLDSCMYTLGGVHDAERGWGRADESWRIMTELRAYGAGILSSYGEIQRFRDADVRPLDFLQMGTLSYDITAYQQVLFAAASFDHLVDAVGGFFSSFDDETPARLQAAGGVAPSTREHSRLSVFGRRSRAHPVPHRIGRHRAR